MSNQAVIERLEKSRLLFRAYCAKPEPNDLYDKQAWNMAGVHLILTESMLSVYKQAEHIKQEDHAAFALYALFTMGGVHYHHLQEETEYLPRLEPEFKSPIVDEHHLFTEPLHHLEQYLQDVTGVEPNAVGSTYIQTKNPKPKPPFDGRRITAGIESFAEPMMTHLEHEIQYLQGDNLRACGLPLSKLEGWAQYEKGILKNLDPWLTLPFVCGHTPPNSRFPTLPPGVRSFFAPWVFHWKYRKSWKFIPPQEPLPKV